MILLIEKGKRSALSTAAFALMESLDADVVQKVRQTASKVRLCRSAKVVMRSRKRNRHQVSAFAHRLLVPIERGRCLSRSGNSACCPIFRIEQQGLGRESA